MAREIEVCDLYNDVKVFKVSHVVGVDDISNIYVFCGSDHAKMNTFFSETFKPMYISNVAGAAVDVDYVGDVVAAAGKKKLSRTDGAVKTMLPYFSMIELENIARENIGVTFLNERIHLDDSVATIKRKVMRALQPRQPDISTSELYVFGKQCVSQLTTRMAYDALSRAGRDVITKVKLANFISNIDKINASTVERSIAENCVRKYNGHRFARGSDTGSGSGLGSGSDSESDVDAGGNREHDEDPYTFEDIRDLNLERKMQVVTACIGHSFVEDGMAHTFAADPFTRVTAYDPQILDVSPIATDSQLLMDCGLFLFNTIFVCTVSDVLEFSTAIRHKNDADGAKALKTYFPFIAKQMRKSSVNISIDTYRTNNAFKRALADSARADLADESFARDCANVDFFYEVHDNRDTSVTNPSGGSESFSYADQGIRQISVAIAPENATIFPIDAVFKTVCTSDELLFIKLNYARRDNVYKIHSPNTNRYGNRVPLFKLSEFNQINGLCGRHNSISLYFSRFASSATVTTRYCNHVICEFDTAGRIFVSVALHHVCNTGTVDEIIRSVLNPVIKKLNDAFEQNGMSIAPYASVYDTRNVRVTGMEYELRVKTDRQVNLGDIFRCSESIFTKPEFHNKNKNVTVMNLKRVSDFDEQRFNDDNDDNDDNESDSKQRPGSGSGIRIFIDTDTDKLTRTSNLTIKVEGVNNVYYLSTIPIYVDALLRIFHNERTKIPLERIQKMCLNPQVVAAPVVAAAADLEDVGKNEENESPKPKAKPTFFLGNMFADQDSNSSSDSEGSSNSSSGSSSSSESSTPRSGGAKGAKGVKFVDNPLRSPKAKGPTKSAAKANPDVESGQKKNPFLDRLQKADKVLFFISNDPKEKGYARCCQKRSKAHNHSQPVALTDEEMVELDPDFATNKDYELHADDMSKTSFYRYSERIESVGGKPPVLVVNAYRFGSTEQTARWYICPRFWNLDTNAFVSEREAIAKYYDSSSRKFKLPKGVYEFESGVEPYVKLYPGFVEQMHNHKLVRMPCCFTTALNNIRYTSAEEKVDAAAKKAAEKWAKMSDAERRAAPPLPPDAAVTVPEWKARAMATGLIPTLDKIHDEKVKTTTTIFDANKRSLKLHQLGHLPVSIQKFFFSNSGSEDCSAIGRECLLRRGVEKGKRDAQSIIGAIAYIHAEYVTVKTNASQTIHPLSVKNMRRAILESITLDSFITYHNGSLVTQFQYGIDRDDAAAYEIPADSAEYRDSIIYAQLMKSAATDNSPDASEQKKLQLNKICIAFDNFKRYFDDDDTVLDSTILWDIVSTPNPKLFAEGNNMIILELPDNDDTHNVRIVCPTNHYSGQFFDRRKPTFFLIKKYGLYEPICLHRVNSNSSTAVMYRFNMSELSHSDDSRQPKLFLNVKRAIEFAKRVQNKYCAPPDSIHAKYYKSNHPAKYIERILLHHRYAITSQVLNHDNRVIGFMVQKQTIRSGVGGGVRGYIPTESSEILMDFNSIVTANRASPRQIPKYDMMYTDDPGIAWDGFTATAAFLEYVRLDTKSKVMCMPKVKVLDDSGRMVIGLITETNQFVRTKPEENRPDAYDDDGSIASASAVGVKGDHFLMDKIVLLNQAPPFNPVRQKIVKNIQIESNFYRAFRITARVVLNRYLTPGMRKHRAAIEAALSSAAMPYSEKMRVIEERLRMLLADHVNFNSVYDAGAISEVFSCITNEACKKKAGADEGDGDEGDDDDVTDRIPTYCTYDAATKTCRLNIPKYKLSSDEVGRRGPSPKVDVDVDVDVENEPIYYARLADELVRHDRSRLFLLKSNAYLFTGRVRYRSCENELIVLQSDIDNKFFNQAKNMPDAIDLGRALKPNTSFFNAKRSDKSPPAYDESFMRAVRPAREYKSRSSSSGSSSSGSSSSGSSSSGSSDSEDEGGQQLPPSPPRVVNKPVSAHIGERLVDPTRFTMDVFEGTFPTRPNQPSAQQTGGSSEDAVKETVNGHITFAIMANILHLESRIDANENVNKIKTVLCDRYAELKNFEFSEITAPLNKICKIFKHFGMSENADAVLKKLYSDETLIRSSRYVLTAFDIWLLADYYKVPIIIMSDAAAATATASGSASFRNAFFGVGGRTLYTDTDDDAVNPRATYVIVSLRPLQEFPVYGILSYAGSDQVGPTHRIPVSALKQTDEPNYASTPSEFLNIGLSPAAAAAAAAAAPSPPPVSDQQSRWVPVPEYDSDEAYPDISSLPQQPTAEDPEHPEKPSAVEPRPFTPLPRDPKPVVRAKVARATDTNQIITEALAELADVTKQTDDIVESRTVSDLQTKLTRLSKRAPTAGTGAGKEM